MAQRLKCLPGMQETRVRSLGWEDPLEKEMATHSSILAWKIPWAEGPGGLTFYGAAELDMTKRVSTHVRKLACPLLLTEIPYKCSKVVATPTSLQRQPGRKESLDHLLFISLGRGDFHPRLQGW